MIYLAYIHKDDDSDYGVSVPSLPGCFSAGSTIEEALVGIREAIECHLEGLALDGEPLPLPSETVDIPLSEEPYTVAAIHIDLEGLSTAKERVNLSIPKFALRHIDKAAGAAGVSRSAYMVESALKEARNEKTA